MTCQAHPFLVKKGESGVRFVPFKIVYLGGYLACLFLSVSCRCPSGSLETPPRWHATIYISGIISVEFTNFGQNMDVNQSKVMGQRSTSPLPLFTVSAGSVLGQGPYWSRSCWAKVDLEGSKVTRSKV